MKTEAGALVAEAAGAALEESPERVLPPGRKRLTVFGAVCFWAADDWAGLTVAQPASATAEISIRIFSTLIGRLLSKKPGGWQC